MLAILSAVNHSPVAGALTAGVCFVPALYADAAGQPSGAQPEAPAPAAESSARSHHSSSASADWDASDDWEPDVSCLRSASSFEKQRDKQVVLQPFQSSPHPQRHGGSSPQPTRFAMSEPATSVKGSSGGGSSRLGSSGGGSRPRGRGQSKCGMPTSDSDDEALLAAGEPVLVCAGRLVRFVAYVS
jgi:hypothetical protein